MANKSNERLKQYLSDVTGHLYSYVTSVNGKKLIVYPEHVMSPRYCHASRFMADVVLSVDMKDKSVLEIGTGSGVQSVMAAKGGAKEILAVDMNPYAVLNANENFARHQINGEARLSDLFNAIGKRKKYDRIIFEAPYGNAQAKSFLELGVSDYQYNTLTRFFEEAGDYLKKDGQIVVGFSPYYGDFAVIQNLITDNDYRVLKHHHEVHDGRSWSAMQLVKR